MLFSDKVLAQHAHSLDSNANVEKDRQKQKKTVREGGRERRREEGRMGNNKDY